MTIIRPQDWVAAFYNKPVVDILAGFTAFFLIFERAGRKGSTSGFVRMPQGGLMVGFFASILMSHIAHTYFGGLTDSFSRFLPTFILFFLLLNGINTERKFKVAVWLIILLIVILVPQGIYQLEHGYGWAGQRITRQFEPDGSFIYRINWIGIFNDPNDLALLFVVAVGFVLAFLFGRTRFFLRVFSLGILGSLFYGIYLCNSRGGLVALMTTAYFYFIKRTNKLFWGGLIGALVAFALFAAGPSRMALLNVEEESAYNRLDLWYEGVLMMKSNPIFGVGYRMFMEELPQTAHNSFILAGAELGILGLFFWMALIWCSVKGLLIIQQNEKIGHDIKTYALGLQSALVGFCAAAFFLSRTYVILPYILFALSGSLMFVAKQKDNEIDFAFHAKDAWISLGLSVGIITLAYILIKIGL